MHSAGGGAPLVGPHLTIGADVHKLVLELKLGSPPLNDHRLYNSQATDGNTDPPSEAYDSLCSL